MSKAVRFGEVLEGIETLSLEDQEILKEILHRRIVERRREEWVRDVRQAQQEFQAGECRPVTPEELMNHVVLRVQPIARNRTVEEVFDDVSGNVVYLEDVNAPTADEWQDG